MKMMDEIGEWPECVATTMWEKDGLRFCLIDGSKLPDGYISHFCGYVIFPKRFLREKGYHGIVTYVPVHGGITLAKERDDGSMVYGFDCAHCDDEGNPNLRDEEWLKRECERMATGLKLAAKYERRYLRCTTNEGKANALDDFHKEVADECGAEFNVQDNFGVMINLLAGQL